MKSLAAPKPSGISSQPSEQAAVLPSTVIELGCSPQTVNALLAMLLGLMQETLSPDAFHMAMRRAARIALEAGVSQDEWARVGKIVERRYQVERRKNPLHSMF